MISGAYKAGYDIIVIGLMHYWKNYNFNNSCRKIM